MATRACPDVEHRNLPCRAAARIGIAREQVVALGLRVVRIDRERYISERAAGPPPQPQRWKTARRLRCPAADRGALEHRGGVIEAARREEGALRHSD